MRETTASITSIEDRLAKALGSLSVIRTALRVDPQQHPKSDIEWCDVAPGLVELADDVWFQILNLRLQLPDAVKALPISDDYCPDDVAAALTQAMKVPQWQSLTPEDHALVFGLIDLLYTARAAGSVQSH